MLRFTTALILLLTALSFAAVKTMRDRRAQLAVARPRPASNPTETPAPDAPPDVRRRPPAVALSDVRSWACQLQGLEVPGAVERLVDAPVDMLVLEPTNTVVGQEAFLTREVVARLRASPGATTPRKLCIAYVNVGQAEDYRSYWRPTWHPDAASAPGAPGFVLCPDPEGWPGNYPVAYWHPDWRAVLYGRVDSLVDRAIADGFDGVYLDWVLGFVDPTVCAAAARANVNPARAMAVLVRDLRAYARGLQPGFVVIAQNPAHLIDLTPEVAGYVDGVSQEGLSYRGRPTSDWDAPEAGDRPRPSFGWDSTAAVAALLTKYRRRGLPVFTLDYALKARHVREAGLNSRALGFVPCVSRTPLDRLPEHVLAADGDAR